MDYRSGRGTRLVAVLLHMWLLTNVYLALGDCNACNAAMVPLPEPAAASTVAAVAAVCHAVLNPESCNILP